MNCEQFAEKFALDEGIRSPEAVEILKAAGRAMDKSIEEALNKRKQHAQVKDCCGAR